LLSPDKTHLPATHAGTSPLTIRIQLVTPIQSNSPRQFYLRFLCSLLKKSPFSFPVTHANILCREELKHRSTPQVRSHFGLWTLDFGLLPAHRLSAFPALDFSRWPFAFYHL